MKLWIGNISPGTSDEEVRGLIAKYAPVPVVSIERVEGDGSRPGAMLEVTASPEALQQVIKRLNGMHFKGREIFVQVMTR